MNETKKRKIRNSKRIWKISEIRKIQHQDKREFLRNSEIKLRASKIFILHFEKSEKIWKNCDSNQWVIILGVVRTLGKRSPVNITFLSMISTSMILHVLWGYSTSMVVAGCLAGPSNWGLNSFPSFFSFLHNFWWRRNVAASKFCGNGDRAQHPSWFDPIKIRSAGKGIFFPFLGKNLRKSKNSEKKSPKKEK